MREQYNSTARLLPKQKKSEYLSLKLLSKLWIKNKSYKNRRITAHRTSQISRAQIQQCWYVNSIARGIYFLTTTLAIQADTLVYVPLFRKIWRERARSFYSIKYIFSRVVAVDIQRVFLSVYLFFFLSIYQISCISSLCSRFSIIRADCLVARMSGGECNAGAFLTHRLQFFHDLTAHQRGTYNRAKHQEEPHISVSHTVFHSPVE